MLFFIVLFIAAALSILYYILPSSTVRIGAAGENEIVRRIRRYGYVLQNLYLPRFDGTTTEVDVLLISTKGLFLIESKNYKGFIFGDEYKQYWTVSLYAGKNWIGQKQTEKHRFYNPLWQNRSHVKYLRKLVGSRVPIYSLIVFSDRGNLRNIRYDAGKANIMQTGNLRSFFSFVEREYPDVMTEQKTSDLYNRLLRYTEVEKETKQRHVEGLYHHRYVPTVCPVCGGKLVIRTAHRGTNAGQQFYGCSNYPDCRYTRNIPREGNS